MRNHRSKKDKAGDSFRGPAPGQTGPGNNSRLDRAELTLIGISSFPRGSGGFVEVYYPATNTKPTFASPPMPQVTHNFNTSGLIKFLPIDEEPTIRLEFKRKRAKSADGKPPIAEVASHIIDIRETPSGMFIIPIGETSGKLKLSIQTYDASGALVSAASAIAEGEDEDDLLPRLLPKFRAMTSTGTITVTQLAQIALQLGIDCDAETLAAVVPKEMHESVYLEDSVDYLARALRDERAGTADTTAATGQSTTTSNAAPLSPFDYIYQKCAGTLHPDSTWSCRAFFTARNLLLISTLLTLSACAAVIIAYCSVTWLNGALTRQQTLLQQSQSIMGEFMTLFERNQLSAVSDAIVEKTQTVATWFARHYTEELQEVQELMGRELVRLMPVRESVGNLTTNEYVKTLSDRAIALQALANIAVPSIPSAVVIQLIQKWVAFESIQNARGETLVARPLDTPEFQTFVWGWDWLTFVRDVGILDTSISTDPAADGGFGLTAAQVESQYCPSATDFANAVPGYVFEFDRAPPPNAATTLKYSTIALRVRNTKVDLCFVLPSTAKQGLHIHWMDDRTNDLNHIPVSPVPEDPVQEEFLIWVTYDQAVRYSHGTTTATDGGDGLLVRYTASALPVSTIDLCATKLIDCNSVARWAYELKANNVTKPAYASLPYYDGTPSLLAGFYSVDLDAVFTLRRSSDIQLSDFLSRSRDAFNFLNFHFVLTTEVVMSGYNDDTNAVIPQFNTFRFSDDCHGGMSYCHRSYWASQTANSALRTKGAGYLIRPDYRPEPCISAYAYMGDDLNRGTVIERDVQDVRSGSLSALVNMVTLINQAAFSTYEMMMLKYDGFRTSKTFDQTDFSDCDQVYCIVRDGILVWRDDCLHCETAPSFGPSSTFQYLTPLRFADECTSTVVGKACDSTWLNTHDDDFVREAMSQRPGTGETRVLSGTDYRGVSVTSAFIFLDNLTTTVMYKVDVSSLSAPIIQSITISAAVASACMVVGLALVIFATAFVIRRSEKESEQYKSQVNAEKERFAASVSHLVPPHIAPKLKVVQQSIVVVETSPNATVVNIDLVGFGEKTRGWSASQFLTYASYHFTVLIDLAKRHNMFNLKSFGDVFVGVGGFGRIDDKTRDERVMDSAKFAVIVIQLLSSKEFNHAEAVHSHSKISRQLSKQSTSNNGSSKKMTVDVSSKAVEIYRTLPQLRIGCHCGHVVMGYVDVGSTPRYDGFGPALQIAARMQSTAAPSKIHCSQEYKEALERADTNFDFEFDVQRRTILKGRTTHGSFILKSAHVPVPEDFVASFEMQRAALPLDFEKPTGEDARRHADGSSSVASSMKSGKSGMSARSSVSRR